MPLCYLATVLHTISSECWSYTYGGNGSHVHCVQDVGSKNSTIFIPSNPGHVGDLSAEASFYTPLYSLFIQDDHTLSRCSLNSMTGSLNCAIVLAVHVMAKLTLVSRETLPQLGIAHA